MDACHLRAKSAAMPYGYSLREEDGMCGNGGIAIGVGVCCCLARHVQVVFRYEQCLRMASISSPPRHMTAACVRKTEVKA